MADLSVLQEALGRTPAPAAAPPPMRPGPAAGTVPLGPDTGPLEAAPAPAAPAAPSGGGPSGGGPSPGLSQETIDAIMRPIERSGNKLGPVRSDGTQEVLDPSGRPLANGQTVRLREPMTFDESFDDKLSLMRQAVQEPSKNATTPTPPTPPKKSGVLANIGAGSTEGVTGLLGMPVDLVTGTYNAAAGALGLPTLQDPVGGSRSFNRLFGVIGANPEDIEPADATEKLARVASAGVSGSLLPGGVAKGLIGAGALGGSTPARIAANPSTAMIAQGASPTNLVGGGVGAMTGSVAAEAAPESLAPTVDILGNIAGGAATAAASAGARAAGRGAVDMARSVRDTMGLGKAEVVINPETGQPFTTQVAGEPITATRGQQGQAARALASTYGMEPGELAASIGQTSPDIPGQATMGQLANSLPGMRLERTLRTANQEPFIAREAANNAARARALAGLSGPDDSHAAAADFFRRRLDSLSQPDANEIADVDALRNRIDTLPQVSPDQAGAQMAGMIERQRAPAVAAAEAGVQGAEQAATEATQALGGGPETRLQTEGANIQRSLATAAQAKDAQVNRLFNAVDPDGTMSVDMAPVRRTAEAITSSDRPFREAPKGEVARVIDLLQSKLRGDDGFQWFRDARDIRTQITDALRWARGPEGSRTQVGYASQLLDSWHNALGQAIGEQAARDSNAMLAGRMKPGESIGARMAAASPEGVPAEPLNLQVGTTVFTPSGREIEVRYRLMEADDLQTSHDAEGRPNPAYPQELQPRDRTRTGSQLQIQRMQREFQPGRLGASTNVNDGAPIVSADGIVESGNARTEAIRQVLAADGPNRQAYLDFLRGQGLDPDGMRNPVLVRERTTELSPAERVRYTQEAAADVGLAVSPSERARIDAGRIDDAVLNLWRGGSVTSAENAPFVRAFIRNVTEPGQEGSLATDRGRLSVDGERRIEAALLQAAYGDNRLVSALAEVGDPNLRAFGGALSDAAGNMARLTQDIQSGRVDPGVGIAPALARAAAAVSDARARGVRLRDVSAQGDAFDGGVDGMADALLRVAFGPDLNGRMNRPALARVLNDYAKLAREQSNEARLFGDNLTWEQVLQEARGKADVGDDGAVRGPQAGAGQPDAAGANVAAGNAVPGEGAGTGGAAPAGSQPDAVRAPDAGGEQAPAPDQVGTGQGRQKVEPSLFSRGPGRANMTTEAAQRYAAARSEDVVRRDTYESGAVGDVLERGDRAGKLEMDASLVAPRIFHPTRASAEDVQGLLRALGGATDAEARVNLAPLATEDVPLEALMEARARALRSVEQTAAMSLRRAAEEDGTLNPAKAQRWLRDHAAALDSFPNLRARFANAADLRTRLDELRAERQALEDANPLGSTRMVADLTRKYWPSGVRGAEAVRQYIADTGGSPDAMRLLDDVAASDLRSRAVRNGEWSRAGYESWMRDHASALNERPELQQRFGTVQHAQDYVTEAANNRVEAVKAYQDGAARHYLSRNGADVDPQAAITGLMRSRTASADARDLWEMTKDDPMARRGLQRNLVEWVQNRVESATEAGVTGTPQLKSNAFRTLQEDPRFQSIARTWLTPAQQDVLDQVAYSMALEARAQSATAIRGSPGTAADIAALAKSDRAPTLLTQLVIGQIGAEGLGNLMALTGPWGLALRMSAMVGSYVYNARQHAGLANTRDLMTEAVLNPELGRVLLQRAVTDPRSPILDTLKQRLAAASVLSAARGKNDIDRRWPDERQGAR